MQTPSPAVQESLTWLADGLDQVLDETMHLCHIPAPTFEEAERAEQSADAEEALPGPERGGCFQEIERSGPQ